MSFSDLKNFIIGKLKNELSDQLTYHNAGHTLSVFSVSQEYIDRLQVGKQDALLLLTAALFHDTGFMWVYSGHEEKSIAYAREVMPKWNYSEEDIEIIAGIIRATKIPQKANTLLEQIIGDADLDYLGTDKFYQTSETLYQELLAKNKISTLEEWDRLQVSFLKSHRYHTEFAQQYREPIKQQYLNEIMDKWSWKD